MTIGIQEISDWFKVKQELAAVKTKEMMLRIAVFDGIFAGKAETKAEGTNKFQLPDHWELKAVTSLDRKVDIASARAIAPEMKELGVIMDDLIEWEPKLNLREYRTLSDEQRKLFDTCLTIKPGTPQMDVVLPAKFKSQGGQELAAPTVTEAKTPF